MRRRSSAPAPGEVTTDPHTGQGASVGALAALLFAVPARCLPPAPPVPPHPLPRPSAIPPPQEPLHQTIRYPYPLQPIQAKDSPFPVGGFGPGLSQFPLSINGFPVSVAP